MMSRDDKPFSPSEYERMAHDLEMMAESIRLRPEMNHHFAERLALLAKQMREDQRRVYPVGEVSP
jgi:hypothetical protein